MRLIIGFILALFISSSAMADSFEILNNGKIIFKTYKEKFRREGYVIYNVIYKKTLWNCTTEGAFLQCTEKHSLHELDSTGNNWVEHK